MDFAFSADQDELRATARRLLGDRLPPTRLQALADAPDGDGTSSALWSELAGLGWVGLSGPDGGGSFLDEAVLLEEGGYALLPDPFLASVVCLPAVTLAPKPDPTAATVLAWAEPAGPQTFRSAASVKTWATQPDGAWQLTGTKSDIADLGSAAQVVVLAASESGPRSSSSSRPGRRSGCCRPRTAPGGSARSRWGPRRPSFSPQEAKPRRY